MPTTKTLAVGERAPAFTLLDQSGQSVSLTTFKGQKNVVLIFYPGDMTPGCTMQLCAIRDDWSKFTALDTVVLGVNPADAESHGNFRKKYTLPFPLLIDADKTVSAKYGALRTLGPLKLIKRTVVVVNKEGEISYLKPGMPKNTEILKAVTGK